MLWSPQLRLGICPLSRVTMKKKFLVHRKKTQNLSDWLIVKPIVTCCPLKKLKGRRGWQSLKSGVPGMFPQNLPKTRFFPRNRPEIWWPTLAICHAYLDTLNHLLNLSNFCCNSSCCSCCCCCCLVKFSGPPLSDVRLRLLGLLL